MKDVYSTGEAAKICRVSQQTIIRCFDSGKLQGFYVPGSRFRRIPRESLVKFMKENQIPLSNLDSSKKKVLVVDDTPEIVDMLVESLERDGRFEVKTATCGYDAGLLTQQFHPDVIVIDYVLNDINANVVCKAIRSNPGLEDTRIIVISGLIEDDKIQGLSELGVDAFMRKPFQIDDLIGKMVELLKI
ncbi:MAG: response regulator [Planctomycetota bacterium]|jgi:excisionase family DNA binding protein|nr:response regulator [Planctomycetota bacterium]